jgi:hypothetical protein
MKTGIVAVAVESPVSFWSISPAPNQMAGLIFFCSLTSKYIMLTPADTEKLSETLYAIFGLTRRYNLGIIAAEGPAIGWEFNPAES